MGIKKKFHFIGPFPVEAKIGTGEKNGTPPIFTPAKPPCLHLWPRYVRQYLIFYSFIYYHYIPHTLFYLLNITDSHFSSISHCAPLLLVLSQIPLWSLLCHPPYTYLSIISSEITSIQQFDDVNITLVVFLAFPFFFLYSVTAMKNPSNPCKLMHKLYYISEI